MTMLHYSAQPKEFDHAAPGPRALHAVIHVPAGGAPRAPGAPLPYGPVDASKVFESALVNVTRGGPAGGGPGAGGMGAGGGAGVGGIRKMRKAKKLHLCSFCQKPFTKVSNQKIHERLHTGEKPYQCRNPGCGKWFMWRSSINFHEKKCLPKAGLSLDSTPFRDERRKSPVRRPPLLFQRQPLAAAAAAAGVPVPPAHHHHHASSAAAAIAAHPAAARLPPIHLGSRPYPAPSDTVEVRPPLTCPTSMYPPSAAAHAAAAAAAAAAASAGVPTAVPKFAPPLQTRFDFPVEFIEGAITDCT